MKYLMTLAVLLFAPMVHAQTVCTGVPWLMTGKIRPGALQVGQIQYVNAELPSCADPSESPEWSVMFVDASGNETPVQFVVLANPRTIYFNATQNGLYRVSGTVWWQGSAPSTSASISFRRGNLN